MTEKNNLNGDNATFTMLIVDDEVGVLNSLKRFLARTGYCILVAENSEKCLATLANNTIDLVLLDLKMPGVDGMETLKQIRFRYPEINVIIQTGHGGVSEAVQAMKIGASDFLIKGEPVEILQNRIKQIYQHWLLERENIALRNLNINQFHFEPLVGASPPIQHLKQLIVRVAPTDTTVLIQGESGTGKELIAKALHHHSDRRDKPFIALDCAAISESLLESELFGHEKGAFTGADCASQGLIRSANFGTLFLDEIGEISLQVQAKLLRTIQERTVRPVGSTKTFNANVRIVAATNRNLLDEVARSTFRQDLYYRISTVTITAPPLRERGSDIGLLTRYILESCASYHGKPAVASPACLDLLSRYDWPGNVRELDNVLRGAAVFSDNGILQPDDLPPALQELKEVNRQEPKKTSVAAFEKEAIKNALIASNYDRKEAVRMLGISEATLYRKIKKYNLKYSD